MEKKSEILNFAETLFENEKEKGLSGIHIRMADGSILTICLYESKNGVEISINGKLIGILVPYSGQGYKYEFKQTYRIGIRNGRTLPESFMEDVCNANEYIRLSKAYH